jgi:hypothetical protein
MNYTISAILYLSILLPVVIGCIRFVKMDPAYYPFIFCLIAGMLHEIISFFVIRSGGSNALVSNIYVLLENCLILWLFYNLSVRKQATIYLTILITSIIVWSLENFAWFNIAHRFSSYFIIFSSFITVLLSIGNVNGLIIKRNENLLKDASFLISLSFVCFFSYAIIVEIFWLYGINSNSIFEGRLQDILEVINLITNLTFALAILWIPRKQKFILPSSPPASS